MAFLAFGRGRCAVAIFLVAGLAALVHGFFERRGVAVGLLVAVKAGLARAFVVALLAAVVLGVVAVREGDR